ncbi:IgGFc-binding protein-like [Engystomops pustulosus]|uniref:IgGFc-binding protein-like n=1 Tax=Engystomops pustulosus TaxID=76066 RepID=UPI003AFB6230
MDSKLFLCAWAFLWLGGFAVAQYPGTDFALVFMQNALTTEGTPQLELLLTSFFPGTKVNIQQPMQNFSKVVSLSTGIPTPVELPKIFELSYSVQSNMTVRITSNNPISVVAINKRPPSIGVAVLSPISHWGNEYYIMTPDSKPGISVGQMAIVNGPKRNIISILLTGLVQLENTTYPPGEQLDLTLEPWESVQLQTNQSLTATHLWSQEVVAVFSGLGCIGGHGLCNHLYTQLPAKAAWGSNFVLPPLSFPNLGKITIVSASDTEVELSLGNDTTKLMVGRGGKQEFEVDTTNSAVITSSRNIMVILDFGVSSGIFYNLLPMQTSCVAYSIVSMPEFENSVLLVAHEETKEQLELDRRRLLELTWKNLTNSELIYTSLPLPPNEGYHFIYNHGQDFSLVSIGIGKSGSYGLPGICLDKVYLLCQFECANAVCNIHGDLSDCISMTTQTCMAWSETHLLTIYNSHMRGIEDCPHVLIHSYGDDLSLRPFSVEREAISAFIITIRVFGQLLKISTEDHGAVFINDVKLYTPISVLNGSLNITRLGFVATMVNVSFGLRVIIGDSGFIHLQFPGRYYESLSGDCVAQPSRRKIRGPLYPGLSVLCEPMLVEDENQCSNKSSMADLNCQILSKSNIFHSCRSIIDPRPFIESCKSEVCSGASSCSAIESYALACAIYGVHLEGWRNISHCGLQCPRHSHYESYTTTCQASCSESQISTCDPSLFFETCLCDEGYEVSAGSCVIKKECGCFWQGSYYLEGKEFLTKDCKKKCQCSGSKMVCRDVNGCHVGNKCELRNGLWSCQPLHRMSCTLYGDTHYTTFDGNSYTFNGICDSRMAGLCANSSDLDAFEIHLVKDQHSGTSVQAVKIAVYGKSILMSPNFDGKVDVNGTLFYTPYVVDTSLQIYRSNHGAEILQTDFGLVVSFDHMRRLQIKIPDPFVGMVCGLCSSMVDRVSKGPLCQDYCQGVCSQCLNEKILPGAAMSCEIIKDPQGFFRECHRRVPPDHYFESCVNDLCSNVSWCPTLYAYAAACREMGAEVYPWRQETSCGYECPPNSTYTGSNRCVSSCQSSCYNTLPITCVSECQDGCQCNPGYVLSGDHCVLPEDCGCYKNGQYWKPGSIFYDDQCRNKCSCLDGGIVCESHSCTLDEECTVVMGVRACYPLSSTCSTSGPTFLTLDKLSFPFNNSCLFVMASLNSSKQVNFEVLLRRKALSGGELPSVQEAIVKIHGYEIVLNMQSEGPKVNGALTNFPVELSDQVVFYKTPFNIVMKTNFNLWLVFNSSMVSLNVPIKYVGKVLGLCGMKNVSAENITNLPTENHMSLWSSYVEHNFCASGNDPFNATKYCDLIMEDYGPFQECHSILGPQGFYNNCLSALNVNEDDLFSICKTLHHYEQACKLAGATIHPWNDETHCQLQEPPFETLNLSATSPTSMTDLPFSTSPTTSPIHLECLPRVVPLACSSLDKTSCLFQAPSFPRINNLSSPLTCSWSLAEICNNDTEVEKFSVLLHYDLGNHSLESLHVEVYGLKIIVPRMWENGVLVNNVTVSLPACLVPGKLQISIEGSSLILNTACGLAIKYDHHGFILVQIPFMYQNYICGQCAQKEPHENQIKFTSEMSNNYSENQCLTVTKEPWTRNEDDSTSPNYCSMFLGNESPFRDCHRVINPDRFHDECRFHVCQDLQRGESGDEVACRDLEEYVTLCQLQSVTIKPWRNESFCPFVCSPHGTYELCTRTCIQCQNGECLGPCQEGCNCTEGYLWNGIGCVPADLCLKRISPSEPEYLNCDSNSTSQSLCRFCSFHDKPISTFGNVSSLTMGNGVYDILRKCDDSTPNWLRIALHVRSPKPAKLHIFYERSFITIHSTLEVWVNGKLRVPPVTLAPELYVVKSSDMVTLGQPGNLRITFSSAGDLKIEVAQSLSAELCGACTFGNPLPMQNQTFSLESWLTEDLL